MSLVDTHAHLEALGNLEEALDSAIKNGVSKIITIGTSLESSKIAANLALSCSRAALEIWATAGIHPGDGLEDIEKFGTGRCVETLQKIILSDKKIVGVGECGLDYYLDASGQRPVTSHEDKQVQRRLFSEQVKLAVRLGLPLVVHCRNAWEDVFDLISKFQTQNSKMKGVFHSFTGGVGEVKKAVELGFYISFSGIVTFKSAGDIQNAAKVVPADRILVETDSPYLSPEPFRGQKNEPGNVKIIASFLANLRKSDEGEFFLQTFENAQKLFKI